MQYPYPLSELVTLSQRVDEVGSSHTVYNLPASKNWQFKFYLDGVISIVGVMHRLGFTPRLGMN